METSTSAKRYHHGDLRRALLDRAAEVIAERGVAGVTLRGLAADIAVSHTAAGHHFGGRAGLLSALAAEGFRRLSGAMADAAEHDDLLGLGLAYVRFALAEPSRFAVMFDTAVLDPADAELHEARTAAMATLRRGVDAAGAEERGDAATVTIAAWGMMHGIATLALSGALDAAAVRGHVDGGDIVEIARRAASLLSVGGSR